MSQVLLQQGDLALLEDPIAADLLRSRQPARLAYPLQTSTHAGASAEQESVDVDL